MRNGSKEKDAGNGRRRALALRALAALLLVAFLAFAVISYRSLKDELTATALARSTAVSQLAAATLSERFDRMVDLAASLASRVRFAELVAQGDWMTAAAILRTVPGEFPYVERLDLASVDGTLRAEVPELPGLRGRSFADRDWFKGVSREQRTYVSQVYRRDAQPQRGVIAVATPVRGRAGGAIAGILVLQLSLDELFGWSKSIALGADASMVLVDPGGQVAYTSGVPAQTPISDLASDPAVRALRAGRPMTQVAADPSGAEWLYAFHPVKHGWGVVIRQPARTAFAARDMQLRLLQAAFALIALLAATLAWSGLRVAARRREALVGAQRSLAQHTERLRILHQIDLALVAEKSAEEIAGAVIQPVREVLGVARAVVNLIDVGAGEAQWLAAAGRQRTHVGPGVRFPLVFMGDVAALQRGEPQLVDTAALPAGKDRDALLDSDVRYYRVVPMIAGGELLGALSFGGPQPEFTDAQLGAASEIATQLALVVHQARLYRQVKLQAGELEARVRERTAELQAAYKELESFSYSVSHDLRAPLRAIDGYSAMLVEDHGAKLDAEGRRVLGVVREAAARMGRLIDDLLAFSRIGRHRLAAGAVDMQALAREVAAELGAQYPAARIELGALPAARGDPALLRQVWVNLLGNALKYSAKSAAPRVAISGKENGAELEYLVADNGAGFDMRYADKLFTVFQRLHRESEFTGTGVGLAIVQRIVARHGGRVWAEGETDRGARFGFALPRAG